MGFVVANKVSLSAFLAACQEGSESAFRRWVQANAPGLLGLTALFLERPDHREAVCRDTLLLAWRNLSGLGYVHKPPQWLYDILGSRLYSQLLALHGSQDAMQRQIAVLAENQATVDSPTGPRPAPLSGEALAAMVKQATPEPLSQRLLAELETLIEAEIEQRQAPLTPTGERVYPPLFDPTLRLRMLRSRTAFRVKEGFKRSLGRPFEDKLFQRWLDGKHGSTWLEEQGLPRRSVEAYAGERLELELDPTTLTRGLNFPESFPNPVQRRKISNFFIWPGPWDEVTHTLADTHRQRFIRDIWAHRLDLTASESHAQLMAELAEGKPLRSHHQGVLLNTEARVLTYLDRYRLYMEDMFCFGFNPALGKDPLGIAIDSQGGMIKSNKGLHRLAMAQTVGLERVTVSVRAVHQQWWERHAGNAKGKEAMDKVLAALPAL
jgi:DNA-directed RNA polymerase specialized sigma24 family protein